MSQRVADGAAVISADDPTRGGDGFTVRGSSSPHPATSRPATANVDTTTTRTDRTNMTPPREDSRDTTVPQGPHAAQRSDHQNNLLAAGAVWPAWMREAACREVGPDLFFTEGKGQHYNDARRVCQLCPVRAECLAYGLQVDRDNSAGGWERHGMFGGLTPQEREQRETEIETGDAPAYDESAVLRRLNGDTSAPIHKADRIEIVRRARALGWSHNEIARRTGIGKVERYVQTDREVAA